LGRDGSTPAGYVGLTGAATDECCRMDTPPASFVQRVEKPTDKKISRCFAHRD
jgi:hypothetical protein